VGQKLTSESNKCNQTVTDLSVIYTARQEEMLMGYAYAMSNECKEKQRQAKNAGAKEVQRRANWRK
jgi:hypothetical protein